MREIKGEQESNPLLMHSDPEGKKGRFEGSES